MRRENSAFDTIINAVIVYDDVEFAAQANAMLERAVRWPGETIRWNVKPWRIDILKLEPSAEAGLAEAVEAHLMLLAVRRLQSLLPWLLNWLERWATRRQFQEAALAVWDGGTRSTPAAQVPPELSAFAGRHNLSLIRDDNTLIQDKPAMFAAELYQRTVSLGPPRRSLPDRPGRSDFRHWGINE